VFLNPNRRICNGVTCEYWSPFLRRCGLRYIVLRLPNRSHDLR
jgi:hypothetical protein